jgi:glycosyltransferase involved in cell wall biosynthesis
MGQVIAIIGNEGFSLLNFRGPLIEDLVARGHRVVALAPDMDTGTQAALKALGAEPRAIALKRTGLNPLADLAALTSLWRMLRRLKPDVTLGYAAKPVIYGTLAAWAARVPHRFAMVEGLGYVFIDRLGDSVRKRMLRRIVEGLYRLALHRAERVFFLNDDDIADFTSMGLVEPKKVIKLGGIGVDLEQWRPVPPVVAPLTFTFVGRLLRDKGVHEFVAAARAIKRTSPETRFPLIGGLDTNPESVSREDAKAWVAEDLVEWPGHVPAQPWLAQTSVFVLPSYREGVPRSTQEAMAMGRPVITTDAPGCRDTVIDGRNGFLVPPRDADALAEAMRRFIATPELIASMGVQSRALAEERFDVRKVNAAIIEAMGV